MHLPCSGVSGARFNGVLVDELASSMQALFNRLATFVDNPCVSPLSRRKSLSTVRATSENIKWKK